MEEKIKKLEKNSSNDKRIYGIDVKWNLNEDEKKYYIIDKWSNESSLQVNGKKFDSGLGINMCRKIETGYIVSGVSSDIPDEGYTKFVGSIGLDDIGSSGWIEMRVIGSSGDRIVRGVGISSSSVKMANKHLVSFEFDIRGCDKISITFESSKNICKPILVNTKFVK